MAGIGPGDRPFQDRTVSQVNAVEVADSYNAALFVSEDLVKGVVKAQGVLRVFRNNSLKFEV
jgi:hypothetical protein